jgi:hypothetical protein
LSEKDGGSVFPDTSSVDAAGWQQREGVGMTLRDWFAGQALTLFAERAVLNKFYEEAKAAGVQGENIIASRAYEIADAMLKERAK